MRMVSGAGACICARAKSIPFSAKDKTGEASARCKAAPYRRCIVHSVSTNIAVLPGGVRRLTLICYSPSSRRKPAHRPEDLLADVAAVEAEQLDFSDMGLLFWAGAPLRLGHRRARASRTKPK